MYTRASGRTLLLHRTENTYGQPRMGMPYCFPDFWGSLEASSGTDFGGSCDIIYNRPINCQTRTIKRLKISMADAIKAIWAELKYVNTDLSIIWTEEHGPKHKLQQTFQVLSGHYEQTLRPSGTTIEIRFGIFAILNVVCFIALSLFIPYFLAEGLQGETVVQAIAYAREEHYSALASAKFDGGIRELVNGEFRQCVNDRSIWNNAAYCEGLRKEISYTTEKFDLKSSVFADSPYRFLAELGNNQYSAIRMSHNISLQDVAFNTRSGRDVLLHELTCVPVDLERRIFKTNTSFELHIPNLFPAYLNQRFKLHDSMILRTSNAVGSGYEIDRIKGQFPGTKPLINLSGEGATWYQLDVDSALPWTEYGDVEHAEEKRIAAASAMVNGYTEDRKGASIQNFLITFKPGQPYGGLENTSDDPIFGAHQHQSEPNLSGYVADREIVAIGCTEVFKRCSEDGCAELSSKRDTIWHHLDLPGIMSIWTNLLVGSSYGAPETGRLRNFLSVWPNHRQHWEEDVEERFIRSMLRVRYA